MPASPTRSPPLKVSSGLKIATNRVELETAMAPWRASGETIGLTPTMGALHAGHLSLIACSRARAERTVATIFVNPTQFAPNEDFAAYPRSFERDCAMLREAGADLVFHPSAQTMYPDGFATSIEVGGPAKAGLEDAVRPTHFSGVATVVAKLLMLTRPDVAFFGEKDWQQVAVVRRVALDLNLPVEIVAAPTVRESDGLAMSSRNSYLSDDERRRAPELHAALAQAARDLRAGRSAQVALSDARRHIERAGFVIDYLELRDARSLQPAQEGVDALRLLAAARIGRTRLIDNVAADLGTRSAP